MELKDNITIEQVKAGLQNYIEMNKAAVDFSRRVIQGSFLLNGGAATALLASKSMEFAGFACSFGIGAFLAVIAMALAYATNLAVAETWACYIAQKTEEEHQKSLKRYYFWITCAVCAGILSGGWFLGTLFAISMELD